MCILNEAGQKSTCASALDTGRTRTNSESSQEFVGKPGPAGESSRREGAVNVLRITIDETPTEKRWILHGRLVGVWVSELRRTWKKTPRLEDNRPCVIDLNDVTFIDEKGVRLLRAMSKQGAQFVATGIYIKHVLQQRCER
jgi:hypothetical protein